MDANVQENDHPLTLETAEERIHGDYSARATKEDEIVVFECPACLKKFTSASNLERHLANNHACKNWIEMGKAALTDRPQWDLEHLRGSEKLTGTLIKSLIEGEEKTTRCVACDHHFGNNSALNRHYKSSLVCDRVRALNVLNDLCSVT